MNKILIFLIVFCCSLVSTAQTQSDKENLNRSIRAYVSILNQKVQGIEQINDIDSVKGYAYGINKEVDSIFFEISKVYKFDINGRDAGAYFGMAYAMDSVVPGSGAYFRVEALDKFLKKTDNRKYFKKLNRLNNVARKIQKSKKFSQINKLKRELKEIVADLSLMELN